ncbi:MAG TPA: SH3 domain-containing protein [Anaerolineaceae bacterium]|nr:SH3 domain-containing protein [Anaerolineaceae bacterium]
MKRSARLQRAVLAQIFISMLLLTACGVNQVAGQTSTNLAPKPVISPSLAFPATATQTVQAPANAGQSTQQTTPVTSVQQGNTGTVSVTQLNLRLGPGLNYNVLKTLNQGSTLTLIGKSIDGEWYEVQLPDGSAGWAFSAYITTSANVVTLPVVQTPIEITATAAPPSGEDIPLTGGTLVPTTVSTFAPTAANTTPIVMVIANNQAQVTLARFPANNAVIATLGALGTDESVKIAGSVTDGNGSASFSFSMPFYGRMAPR